MKEQLPLPGDSRLSARPVRILFLSTTLAMGGAERILMHLVSGMDRSRFDVAVATLRAAGRVGEEIARRGIVVRSGWTGPAKLDPLLIPRLHGWLARERFEILYLLDHPHAVFHGLLASIGTSIRVRVMPVHTTGRWDGKPSVPRSVRFFLPRIDAVIAIAETQRRYLIEKEALPEAKIRVIRNGIPLERPGPEERRRLREAARRELSIEEGRKVMTIVAVLRPEKNHELLLRALARVRKAHPEALLLVVGDGPRRAELEREALRLGLTGHVRFLGADPEGRRFWAASDLAVLCSHPRVETLPLSILEAMDFGLPVVATDVGALAEIVRPGENGALVAPGDEAALASAIGEILDAPATAARYAAASQEIVSAGYESSRMVRETEALLARLMEAASGSD